MVCVAGCAFSQDQKLEIVSEAPQMVLEVQRVPRGMALAGKERQETLAAGRERMSGGGEGRVQALGRGGPALSQVLAAAAASSKFCQRFSQELTHVVGLAGGLGED